MKDDDDPRVNLNQIGSDEKIANPMFKLIYVKLDDFSQ